MVTEVEEKGLYGSHAAGMLKPPNLQDETFVGFLLPGAAEQRCTGGVLEDLADTFACSG